MHQATHVVRGHDFDPGLLVIGHAVLAHQARDRFFAHGKRAAETATFIRSLQFDELDPVN